MAKLGKLFNSISQVLRLESIMKSKPRISIQREPSIVGANVSSPSWGPWLLSMSTVGEDVTNCDRSLFVGAWLEYTASPNTQR